jgi:hypothetical protein
MTPILSDRWYKSVDPAHTGPAMRGSVVIALTTRDSASTIEDVLAWIETHSPLWPLSLSIVEVAAPAQSESVERPSLSCLGDL